MQKVNKQTFAENESFANINEMMNSNEGVQTSMQSNISESNLTFYELYLQCLVEDDN